MEGGYVDEFLKIDWNKPIPDKQRLEFCEDYEEFEANSYTFQMLHDQLIKYRLYVEEEEELVTQEQVQKSNPAVYCPGYDKNLRLPNSLFSIKEMNRLYTYFDSVRQGQNVSQNMMQDQACREAVSEEQGKYMFLAQDMWTRFNYKRAFYVHISVEKYMRELWMRKVEAIQQFYPKSYRQTGSLNFVCGGVDIDNPVYLCEKIVLKKQHCSRKIRIPKYWTHHSIPISDEDLVSKKDPVWCLKKKPVSADEAAWYWARLYKPDVVITASALKALANNLPPHYMTEWNLIVTVKDIDSDGVKKKVVFIDKPLPPCTLTNMQHTEWHAKLASKMLLIDGKKQANQRSEDMRKLRVYNDDDDDWLTYDSDVESFGVWSDNESPSSSKAKVNDNGHIEVGSSDSPQMDSSTNLESSVQENKRENSHLFNYSYKLWNLSSVTNELEEKQKILRKGDSINIRPLSLIVRDKIDGIIDHNGSLSDAIVSSKVEYQEDLGAEVMSLTELVNEWLDLIIRPSSYLLRVRVSYKGEYIMTEKKKISDVEAEALRLYQFNLKPTLKTLQVLLCQLCSLNTGQHYVTHSPNYGAFAHLYTSVSSTTQHVFNLHEFYEKNWSKGIIKEQSAPWKPLDLSIFTPMHFHLKIIPGTFKPSQWNRSTFRQRVKLRADTCKQKKINQSAKKKICRRRKKAAVKLIGMTK